MRISLRDPHNLLTEGFIELAERRLLFALSRFDSKIRRVTLVVSAGHGSGGEVTSELTVTLGRLPAVRVVMSHAEIDEGISHVAGRAGRAVARAIERDRMSAGGDRRPVTKPLNLKEMP